MKYITLNNGMKIPQVGFGTYKTKENDGVKIIEDAIKLGYRLFDTASFYETEDILAKAIENINIERRELIITTKIWKDDMGYENTKKAIEKSLNNLKSDYIDILLIHWPRPDLKDPSWKELDLSTYRAMEDYYKMGKVKALGFSNFLPHHIDNIINNCEIKPSVNQIEFHPGYTQEYTLNYCKELNISVQAWSPMGRSRVFNDEFINKLAKDLNINVAELCLSYAINRGVTVIPKASNIDRMKENLNSVNISLPEEVIHMISTISQLGWSGEHPDFDRIYF